jgi:hypothetical protein
MAAVGVIDGELEIDAGTGVDQRELGYDLEPARRRARPEHVGRPRRSCAPVRKESDACERSF